MKEGGLTSFLPKRTPLDMFWIIFVIKMRERLEAALHTATSSDWRPPDGFLDVLPPWRPYLSGATIIGHRKRRKKKPPMILGLSLSSLYFALTTRCNSLKTAFKELLSVSTGIQGCGAAAAGMQTLGTP